MVSVPQFCFPIACKTQRQAPPIRHWVVLALFAWCCTIGHAQPLTAAPGSVDASFGIGGAVITSFGPGSIVTALARQSDGRVVAAGSTDTSGFVARYLTDGTLDATFNGSGYVLVSSPGEVVSLSSLAIDGHNRIIAAGSKSVGGKSAILLTRYVSTGQVDATFGAAGTVVLADPVLSLGARSLAVASGDKVIAAGAAVNFVMSMPLVVRVDANGNLDSSFGTAGFSYLPQFTGMSSYINGIVVDSSGNTVTAGDIGSAQPALLRLRPDGTLDTSFGTAGQVSPPAPFGVFNGGILRAVALRSDGRILAGGYTGPPSRLAIAQFLPNGAIDTSFGNGGVATAGPTYGFGLCLDANGSAVLVGSRLRTSDYDFVVARFDRDGVLDARFGSGGITVTPLLQSQEATTVLCQPDGTILAAGYAASAVNRQAALVRYISFVVPTLVGVPVEVPTLSFDGLLALALAMGALALSRICRLR